MELRLSCTNPSISNSYLLILFHIPGQSLSRLSADTMFIMINQFSLVNILIMFWLWFRLHFLVITHRSKWPTRINEVRWHFECSILIYFMVLWRKFHNDVQNLQSRTISDSNLLHTWYIIPTNPISKSKSLKRFEASVKSIMHQFQCTMDWTKMKQLYGSDHEGAADLSPGFAIIW